MEMTDSFNRAEKKNAQIEVLAQLNGCDKETIKKILIEGGVPESALPKKRGPKFKNPSKPDVEKQSVPEGYVVPVLDDETVTGTITGGEGDIEEYALPVVPVDRYRTIEEILKTGVKDDKEAHRVARYNAIPDTVKELCNEEMARLHSEIIKLEKRYEILVDYLNGEESYDRA